MDRVHTNKLAVILMVFLGISCSSDEPITLLDTGNAGDSGQDVGDVPPVIA